MEIKIINASDYPVSAWSGGTTTQLYIHPLGADYAKRDFTFRLSSASVECEFSQFTPLLGVQREIMMLDGEIDLCVDGDVSHLGKYDQQSFSGDSNTSSNGKAIDFNLMLRGADGEIAPLEITADTRIKCARDFTFIYMDKGECTAEIEGKSYRIGENSSLLCRGLGEIVLSSELGAHCVLAEITAHN